MTISSNVVRNNDQGGNATTKTGECAPAGQIPGDCGEGLHLMSVTNSHVVGNTVSNNAGGILLTDEAGPTARNVISRNTVEMFLDKVESAEIRRLAANEKGRETNLRSGKPVSV